VQRPLSARVRLTANKAPGSKAGKDEPSFTASVSLGSVGMQLDRLQYLQAVTAADQVELAAKRIGHRDLRCALLPPPGVTAAGPPPEAGGKKWACCMWAYAAAVVRRRVRAARGTWSWQSVKACCVRGRAYRSAHRQQLLNPDKEIAKCRELEDALPAHAVWVNRDVAEASLVAEEKEKALGKLVKKKESRGWFRYTGSSTALLLALHFRRLILRLRLTHLRLNVRLATGSDPRPAGRTTTLPGCSRPWSRSLEEEEGEEGKAAAAVQTPGCSKSASTASRQRFPLRRFRPRGLP
jgi:hypothetical protein